MPAVLLTEDVLVHIFHFVAPIDTTFKDEWKEKLYLLSICSQWRNAALPLVYSHVGICCDKTTKVKSNASLIPAQHIVRFARVLDIHIDLQTPIADLQPALDYLSHISKVWPGIRMLMLNVDYGLRRRIFNKCYTSALKNTNRIRVNSLVKLLPNIVDLQFTGIMPNKESTWLLQEISKKYYKQIKKIKSEYPYVVAGQHYFPGLTHLETGFYYSGMNYQLNVCVDSLEHLTMLGVPKLFDWSGFSKHEHPSIVLFPKLKSLSVDCTNQDKFSYWPEYSLPDSPKLHFPQLKYLKVSPLCNYYHVLENGIFDCVLDHLHLHATDWSLHEIIAMDLPQAKAISLDVNIKINTAVVDVVDMINEFATHAKCTGHIRLAFLQLMEKDMSDEINSEYITHLVIGARLNTAGIVNIMNGLPNLIELEIESYCYDNSLDEFCEESNEHTVAVDSKLELLSLYYYPKFCTMENAIQFLKHMLLRLANVKVVNADSIPYNEMTEFVDQFNVRYPHLSKICFNFYA